MKLSIPVCVMSALFTHAVAVAADVFQTPIVLSIDSQPLPDALNEFARQSGLQILLESKDGAGLMGPKLDGTYTPEAALRELLNKSGLKFQRLGEHAIAVSKSTARAMNDPPFRHHLAEAKNSTTAATDTVAVDQLQTVVVTARRKSENLQSTPVAVTAITAVTLESLNIQDAQALPRLTPNLTVTSQPSGITAASVYIRGIGNYNPSAVSEQGVGIYLDGVYVARPAASLFDLVDLDRVEVLRGPQGTLFGRNTLGGAIQLISKKPTDDAHFEIKAGTGSYSTNYARLRVDTGLIGTSPFKASLGYLHREQDGYFNNTLVSANRDPGALNANAFTAAIRGELDSLTIDYNYDYDQRNGVPSFNQIVAIAPDVSAYFGQSAGLGGAPLQFGRTRLGSGQQEGAFDRNANYRYDIEARSSGHALSLTYALNEHTSLKSITSYREILQSTIFGLSGNGPMLGVVLDPVSFAPSVQQVTIYNGYGSPQRQHQVSQELQALGDLGSFKYVAGIYYFYEKSSEYDHQELTFVLPGGQAGLNLTPIQAFGGTTKSYAGFGQLTYQPDGSDFEVTGGVRYTSDHKTIFRTDVVPAITGSDKFNNVSWLISADYKFTSDAMLYGKVSTGFHSGGFNPRVNFINRFGPEKATAFEAGFKSEWFDRRLRTNLALFYTDYTDLQLEQTFAGANGVTSLITNAGKVVYQGIEFESQALVGDHLSIDASFGYTDPRFKEFPFIDPLTNLPINVANEVKFQQAARFNTHGGAQYSRHLGVGQFTARVDFSYRSRIYFQALERSSPLIDQVSSPPDRNWRARLSLAEIPMKSARMEIGIWGDNLTNQQNIQYGIDFGSLGFGTATFKMPRTYGIDARVNY